MSISRKFRQQFETPLVRLGLLIVPPLPRRAVVGLARFLGTAAFLLSAHLRRVAYANVRIAFGSSLTPTQQRSLVRRSFMTFSLVMLDILWFARDTRNRIIRWVRFDPSFNAMFNGKSQVCVTGHFGNWEILGQAAALRGYTLASVVAPLANPAVDEIFNRTRQITGQKVVQKKGAVRELLKILKGSGKVAILLDQNTRPEEGGLFVDFFRLPVPVSTAGASLAVHTGSEIFFGFSQPQPDGSYLAHSPNCISSEAAPGEDKHQTLARLTQEIVKETENEIRRNPGNWLWMYKRWKYVAPGLKRTQYPFYAKELGGRSDGVME